MAVGHSPLDDFAEEEQAPTPPILSPAQSRGGLLGIILGGLAGVVIGVLIAMFPIAAFAIGTRMVVFAGVLLVAGSVIGGIVGGGWAPDATGETSGVPGEADQTLARRRAGHAGQPD